MKHVVVAALALLAPVAWSQEVSAPKTTDQVRAGFRAAVEICLEANRRNHRLEDIPESEMAGRLTKMSAITQAGSPEPPAHPFWSVTGFDALTVYQGERSCAVGWKGDRTPFDASAEQAGAVVHLAQVAPTLIEQPFYSSPGVDSGRRFGLIDGHRKIPLFVYVAHNEITVAVNADPGPGRVLEKRFTGFENRCVRALYREMKPEPDKFEIGREVQGVAPGDGMLFYSMGRNEPNLGFHPDNAKICALHDSALKIEDARNMIPADLWGVALSIAPAVQGGGTIITARAP